MWMAAALNGNRFARVATDAMPQVPRISLSVAIMALATAMMIGFRYEVGGDWFTYLDHYNLVQLLSYRQALATMDPGYSTLVYIAAHLELGIWFSNLFCGLIMAFGIARFCSTQPNPALSYLIAIPYLIIVVGMGYTRQGVAIGIMLAGLAGADGRSTRRIILYILMASLFHKTALLVMPLALAPLIRRNMLYALISIVAFLILYRFVLESSADTLVAGYVRYTYQSGGAAIRVAMNIVPAVLALRFRRRLGFNAYQQDLWTTFALAALATFPLVLAATFTTAIDRLALFLIPLQIAVLPRLPYVFGPKERANGQMLVAVCVYSAAVQVVWLVFATHSQYWVPYRAFLLST